MWVNTYCVLIPSETQWSKTMDGPSRSSKSLPKQGNQTKQSLHPWTMSSAQNQQQAENGKQDVGYLILQSEEMEDAGQAGCSFKGRQHGIRDLWNGSLFSLSASGKASLNLRCHCYWWNVRASAERQGSGEPLSQGNSFWLSWPAPGWREVRGGYKKKQPL